MTEVLITSSALILSLLLLRRVFRRSLSRRMQYALWALVLVRLLLPFQLPEAEFSVLTSVRPVQAAVERRIARAPAALPADGVPAPGGAAVRGIAGAAPAGEETLSGPARPSPPPERAFTAAQALTALRWMGTALAAALLLGVNTRFALRLRRCRRPYFIEGCSRRTYLAEGLPSPCLFGLLRPAVYLTPAAVSTPERLGHVLAHEETHARHLDPLWALLRCVCLALYWFDPLVWIAAAASRTDCELACDEGTLARLGEGERIAYGQTLLCLVPVRGRPAEGLLTAATMASGKRELQERITRIAQRPRQLAAAGVAAAVLAGAVCACTFTGERQAARPPVSGQADAVLQDWGEPETALSLDGARRYEPEPFSIQVKGEWTQQDELYREGDPYEIHILTSYQEEMQYFAVVDKRREQPEYRCFLALPLGDGTGFTGGGGFPEGLFGQEGPVDAISYRTQEGGELTDYVCIGSDGAPVRLVQAAAGMSETFHVDCDGDGNAEVVAPGQLFFQREDGIYWVSLVQLWAQAYPEYVWDRWSGGWDPATGVLEAVGIVQGEDGVPRNWTRYLRFDGESLLVYKDPRTCEEHVMSGIDAPDAVVEKAKELVRTWTPRPGGAPFSDPAEYDDWRVESIAGPTELQVGGIRLQVYRFNYEYHTATPEKVIMAGGRYITEDDWVMPGYPNCDYLFFQVEEDGDLCFLWHEMSNDMGPEQLAQPGLYRLGLLQDDPVYQVQGLWDALTGGEELTLDLAPADGEGGGAYSTAISWGYNRPGDITSNFNWEELKEPPLLDQKETDVLRVEQGGNSLTFYRQPRLVEYCRDGVRRWFKAEQSVTDDVFAGELFECVRQWYDEIEEDALRAAVVIPDGGRSREEIAREWVQRYEGTHLLATGGSKGRWTYLDVVSMEEDTGVPRESYPAAIGDREAFLIWYSVVFVPENEAARNRSMAGNTMEYEGEDAPEGALQWWRCAYLYRDENGWRCDGTGTGP